MNGHMLRDALVMDVKDLKLKDAVRVLEDHGWTVSSKNKLTLVASWSDANGSHEVVLSNEGGEKNPWHSINMAELMGIFAHAHDLSLMTALTRFGIKLNT